MTEGREVDVALGAVEVAASQLREAIRELRALLADQSAPAEGTEEPRRPRRLPESPPH